MIFPPVIEMVMLLIFSRFIAFEVIFWLSKLFTKLQSKIERDIFSIVVPLVSTLEISTAEEL